MDPPGGQRGPDPFDAVPPKAARGEIRRYERGSFPLPAPEPFEFSPNQFQNGDIILVNGKSGGARPFSFSSRIPPISPTDAAWYEMGREASPMVIHAPLNLNGWRWNPSKNFCRPSRGRERRSTG